MTTLLGIASSFAAGFVGEALGLYQMGAGASFPRLGGGRHRCCSSSSASSRAPAIEPEATPWPAVRQLKNAARRRIEAVAENAAAASSRGARWSTRRGHGARCSGLDWLTDVALLLGSSPRSIMSFGLTPEQVRRLAPDRRVVVYKAITAGGGMLIGRVVTRELVMTLLRVVGVRLTASRPPVRAGGGAAVSALLTFSALKIASASSIRQCMEVARQLALAGTGCAM